MLNRAIQALGVDPVQWRVLVATCTCASIFAPAAAPHDRALAHGRVGIHWLASPS